MTLPFRDRSDAGRQLAEALRPLELSELLVLGVPRGGVATAAPIADELRGELDVIVVRKVGAPRNPELGLGAVGAWGEPVLDQRLVSALSVDDGIATGGTVMAAARLLRAQEPRTLVLAVPVAPKEGLQRAGEVYDRVVCLHAPEPYYAVGQWYEDFHQVSDDEVRRLLGTRRGPEPSGSL